MPEGKLPEGPIHEQIRAALAPEKLPPIQWSYKVHVPYRAGVTGLRCEDCDVAWNTTNGEELCWSCGRQGTQ